MGMTTKRICVINVTQEWNPGINLTSEVNVNSYFISIPVFNSYDIVKAFQESYTLTSGLEGLYIIMAYFKYTRSYIIVMAVESFVLALDAFSVS
jgi:hypothetical protein